MDECCCHLNNAIACLTAALEQLGLSFFFVYSFQPQMNNRVAFAKKNVTEVGGLVYTRKKNVIAKECNCNLLQKRENCDEE